MSKLKEQPCIDCKHRRTSGRCPFQSTKICPWKTAYNAIQALNDPEVAAMIPIEDIVTAARYQGYSGELRQTIIKTV